MDKRVKFLVSPIKRAIRVARIAIMQDDYVTRREYQPLLHRPLSKLAAVPAISGGTSGDDAGIVSRIIEAYSSRLNDKDAPTDQWHVIFETHQKPIHDVLLSRNAIKVAEILRRPGDSGLFTGFDSTERGTVQRCSKNRNRAVAQAALCLDYLITVAELIGAIPLENPEGRSSRYGSLPADTIVDAIERAIGIELEFPNPFPDELGIQTKRGIANERAIQAIYQAWRIKDLVQGRRDARVLEIGAGLGRTAFYAWKMGIRDYTIIDLPFTSVSQAYFLARSLGPEHVILHGETRSDTGGAIKILRPPALLESTQRYDLIANVDSLTEMGIEVASGYWEKIKTSTSVFLSINHEANAYSVREIAMKSPSGIATQQRFPYGVRPGYAEEIFRFGAQIDG